MSQHRPTIFISSNSYPKKGIDILCERCDVDIWPSSEKGEIPWEEYLKKVVGKNGLLICSHNPINQELIAAAGPSLKVISTMSVGVDHIDLEAVKKSGVKLGYTPGVLSETVAELTIGLLLATSRRIIEANKTIPQNQWNWTPTWMCGRGLAGSTVGIFGFGRIGQSVAKKLLAFNVSKIIYNGPRRKAEGDAIGAVFVDFDKLLKESDFLIVLCPLTPETKGIFTKEKFALMKPSAIFINTARGAIVDQDALIYALQNKLILAAGLDVMTPEPISPDHPLTKIENCVLTPHIGSATIETRNEMCCLAVNNLLTALDGVNMPAEYTL